MLASIMCFDLRQKAWRKSLVVSGGHIDWLGVTVQIMTGGTAVMILQTRAARADSPSLVVVGCLDACIGSSS